MLWEEKITEFLDDFNVTDVNREITLEYLDAVQDIGKNPAENTIKNQIADGHPTLKGRVCKGRPLLFWE